MIKPTSHQTKWLAILIILAIATLLIGGCAANQLPVISNLALNSEGEINPGVSCQIECTASDPDEDELTYAWSADGGDITGTGSTVTWTAPDAPGNYTVTAEVSDGRDGIATEQLTINVLPPNHPPVIESLNTDCPRVRPVGHATLECIASDPDNDELTYTWSVDRGGISGDGATVTWTGPDAYGTYTITITVSDGRGGEASDSIDIIVCACGSACT